MTMTNTTITTKEHNFFTEIVHYGYLTINGHAIFVIKIFYTCKIN